MIAGAATIAAGATTPSTVTRAGSTSSSSVSWSILRRLHPTAHTIPQLPRALVLVLWALLRRMAVAEAVIWVTAAVCALAGFPAALTAFCVALVALVVNLWLAVRTLAPIARKIAKGGKA